jgi:hypothetical protein
MQLIKVIKSTQGKCAKCLLIAGSIFLSLSLHSSAYGASCDSRAPRNAPAPGMPANLTEISPKNIPDFADNASQTKALRQAEMISNSTASNQPTGTALKVGAQSTTIPTQTHLKLVLEYPIDAKSSQAGDIFEAHVKEDLFIGNSLLLPRGSLIRGRISEVSRPRLVSRAGKIGLKLEQVVTPTGEVIPLDAALEFKKGTTNVKGQLDPGTNFGTRVENDFKSVTGLNATGSKRNALIAANVATLGAPAAATVIGSSAIALFRSGDNINLAPGQELEILLTNDLGLQIN